MAIGAGKIGLLGAGLTPAGSLTFNAPGTAALPAGVKLVSVTGVGGSGNPGSGTGGRGEKSGGGAGGGGGTISYSIFQATYVACYGQSYTQTAGASSGFGTFSGKGSTGMKKDLGYCTFSGAPVSNYNTDFLVPNNTSGKNGTAGSAGSPSSAGSTGQSSSAIGLTFPGGNAGNGGAGGNAGAAGNGGTGGSPSAMTAQGFQGYFGSNPVSVTNARGKFTYFGSGGPEYQPGGSACGQPAWSFPGNTSVISPAFPGPGNFYLPNYGGIRGASGGGPGGGCCAPGTGCPYPGGSPNTVNIRMVGGFGGYANFCYGQGAGSAEQNVSGRLQLSNMCHQASGTSIRPPGGGGGGGIWGGPEWPGPPSGNPYNGTPTSSYMATSGGGGGGGAGGLGNAGGNANSGGSASPITYNAVSAQGSYPVTVAPGGSVTINWNAQ